MRDQAARRVGVISIPPIWRIALAEGGSGVEASWAQDSSADEGRPVSIVLAPGVGFGTGAHETTQLCLQAIHAFRPRGRSFRMLDFGSGSGILSIAAAKLGGEVAAVEIDDQAIEHSQTNARLNGVENRIRFHRTLEAAGSTFDLVVANILLSVLMQAAHRLSACCASEGVLVLSGLVATDVPSAIACYAPLRNGQRPQVYERGDWRTLAWT